MTTYCYYISPDAEECAQPAKWEIIQNNGSDNPIDALSCTNHLHKFIGTYAKVWPYES